MLEKKYISFTSQCSSLEFLVVIGNDVEKLAAYCSDQSLNFPNATVIIQFIYGRWEELRPRYLGLKWLYIIYSW